MTTFSRASSQLVQTHTCATCGCELTGNYFVLVDREERYCPNCIANRPRCDSCGAPLSDQSWQLHDGRLQCAQCHSTAVYTPAEGQQLFEETVAQLQQQFGLTLHIGVEFRLIDAPTMRSIRSQDPHYPVDSDERTLGLYQKQGRLRAIYMLYGLPRLIFRTTIAHEYAHAWQTENCPLLQDALLREGFAEWIAYHHLLWLGCHIAARRMLNSNHPYRPALEKVLNLEQQYGQRGVLDYLRRAE